MNYVKSREWIIKRIKTIVPSVVLAALFAIIMCMSAFATGTTNEALNADQIIGNKFDVFYSIVAAIVSAIGSIITLWGICEWGIAFQGQDGTSQAHAFKRIAGGMVMLLAPQLMLLF